MFSREPQRISPLADKDVEVYRTSFRKLTEACLSSPSSMSSISSDVPVSATLGSLCALFIQCTKTPADVKRFSIESLLEMVRIRGKILQAVVSGAIEHSKAPTKHSLKGQTIVGCLEGEKSYETGCIFLLRLYQRLCHQNSEIDWGSIINLIARHCQLAPSLSLQVIELLFQVNESNCRLAIRSGFINFILSTHILRVLDDKYQLYRCLKIIKQSCPTDPTLIRHRQANLAAVMTRYEQYIPICSDILSICYDKNYCMSMLKSEDNQDSPVDLITFVYVWSFVSEFIHDCHRQVGFVKATKIGANNQDSIEGIQLKKYGILANMAKIPSLVPNIDIIKAIPKQQTSLTNYLKLILNCTETQQGVLQQLSMLPQIKALVAKNTNFTAQQLFDVLEAKAAAKNKKVGGGGQVKVAHLMKSLTFDNNIDYLMQKSKRVPTTQQHADQLIELLAEPARKNDFQNDALKKIKHNCIHSLRGYISTGKPFDINKLLAAVTLDDTELLGRVLQLTQLYVTMQAGRNNNIDAKKVLRLLDQIETQYDGEQIDWAAIHQLYGQININEKPNRIYAVLGAEKIPQPRLMKDTDHPMYSIYAAQLVKDKQSAELLLKTQAQLIKTHISKLGDQDQHEHRRAVVALRQVVASCVAYNVQPEMYIKTIDSYYKASTPQPHDYSLIEACDLKIPSLSNCLQSLVSKHGDLAANVYDQKLNESGKSTLAPADVCLFSHEGFPNQQYQILKFLAKKPHLTNWNDLESFVKKIQNQKSAYWDYYPMLMGILEAIVDIIEAAKQSNPNGLKDPIPQDKCSSIILSLLAIALNNKSLSQEQRESFSSKLVALLDSMSAQDVQIDQIHHQMSRLSLTLSKSMEHSLQMMSKRNSKTMSKQLSTIKSVSSMKSTESWVDGAQTIESYVKVSKTLTVPDTNQSKSNQLSTYSVALQSNNVQQLLAGPSEALYSNTTQVTEVKVDNTSASKSFAQIIRQIREIVEGKQPITSYDVLHYNLVGIEMQNDYRSILGFWLCKLYEKHQYALIFELLLAKDKTQLNKDHCFGLISKFKEAMVLAKRWKLLGQDWIELFMRYLKQYINEKGPSRHSPTILQTLQLNMIDQSQYFMSKGHHQAIIAAASRVATQEEVMQYSLLIGTGARHKDFKKAAITANLHKKILSMLSTSQLDVSAGPINYDISVRTVTNCCYAISSLVFLEPQIATAVASSRAQMTTLLSLMHKFATERSVVESGCCLITGLASTGEGVKMELVQMGILELLVFMQRCNVDSNDISLFKQLFKAVGNFSISKQSSVKLINLGFCQAAIRTCENLSMRLISRKDQAKAKLLRIFMDLIANLCSCGVHLDIIHNHGVTGFVIGMLETAEMTSEVMMGCIDTIDGLCRNDEVENYCLAHKLTYILIDVLKQCTDKKVVSKATRLLSNLTLKSNCINSILEANLLSVLGNIVVPSFFFRNRNNTGSFNLPPRKDMPSGVRPEQFPADSRANPAQQSTTNHQQKIQSYVERILTRIHAASPPIPLIIKSGYLDCLIRVLELMPQPQIYLDILKTYAKHLPSFLNRRSFICLISVMTLKQKNNAVIQKCLGLFKTLILESDANEQEDVVIEGSPAMYEALLQTHRTDTLFLLSLHVLHSKALRRLLIEQDRLLTLVATLTNDPQLADLAQSILFTVNNVETSRIVSSKELYTSLLEHQQIIQKHIQFLKKPHNCILFRTDGSSKKAIVRMDSNFVIQAFKAPEGTIKSKYCVNLRHLRETQYLYERNGQLWKKSIFCKDKASAVEQNAGKCITLVGTGNWGEMSFVNVKFDDQEQKKAFMVAVKVVLKYVKTIM